MMILCRSSETLSTLVDQLMALSTDESCLRFNGNDVLLRCYTVLTSLKAHLKQKNKENHPDAIQSYSSPLPQQLSSWSPAVIDVCSWMMQSKPWQFAQQSVSSWASVVLTFTELCFDFYVRDDTILPGSWGSSDLALVDAVFGVLTLVIEQVLRNPTCGSTSEQVNLDSTIPALSQLTETILHIQKQSICHISTEVHRFLVSSCADNLLPCVTHLRIIADGKVQDLLEHLLSCVSLIQRCAERCNNLLQLCATGDRNGTTQLTVETQLWSILTSYLSALHLTSVVNASVAENERLGCLELLKAPVCIAFRVPSDLHVLEVWDKLHSTVMASYVSCVCERLTTVVDRCWGTVETHSPTDSKFSHLAFVEHLVTQLELSTNFCYPFQQSAVLSFDALLMFATSLLSVLQRRSALSYADDTLFITRLFRTCDRALEVCTFLVLHNLNANLLAPCTIPSFEKPSSQLSLTFLVCRALQWTITGKTLIVNVGAEQRPFRPLDHPASFSRFSTLCPCFTWLMDTIVSSATSTPSPQCGVFVELLKNVAFLVFQSWLRLCCNTSYGDSVCSNRAETEPFVNILLWFFTWSFKHRPQLQVTASPPTLASCSTARAVFRIWCYFEALLRPCQFPYQTFLKELLKLALFSRTLSDSELTSLETRSNENSDSHSKEKAQNVVLASLVFYPSRGQRYFLRVLFLTFAEHKVSSQCDFFISLAISITRRIVELLLCLFDAEPAYNTTHHSLQLLYNSAFSVTSDDPYGLRLLLNTTDSLHHLIDVWKIVVMSFATGAQQDVGCQLQDIMIQVVGILSRCVKAFKFHSSKHQTVSAYGVSKLYPAAVDVLCTLLDTLPFFSSLPLPQRLQDVLVLFTFFDHHCNPRAPLLSACLVPWAPRVTMSVWSLQCVVDRWIRQSPRLNDLLQPSCAPQCVRSLRQSVRRILALLRCSEDPHCVQCQQVSHVLVTWWCLTRLISPYGAVQFNDSLLNRVARDLICSLHAVLKENSKSNDFLTQFLLCTFATKINAKDTLSVNEDWRSFLNWFTTELTRPVCSSPVHQK